MRATLPFLLQTISRTGLDNGSIRLIEAIVAKTRFVSSRRDRKKRTACCLPCRECGQTEPFYLPLMHTKWPSVRITNRPSATAGVAWVPSPIGFWAITA